MAGNVFFKKAAQNVQKVCEKTVPDIITWTIRNTRKLADTGDETGKLLKSRIGEKSSTDADLHMGQSYLSGVCSMVGGGMKDENWSGFTAMGSHMADAFQEIRVGLEDFTKIVTDNNDIELGYSPLAMVLSNHDYQAMIRKITGGVAKFEE